ncbi:MAG TPA: phage holin family protein [Vicinamibacterales bacterium]
MRFITRLLINAAALWAAIRLVPGISFEGEWPLLFAVALVFGALNAVIRPILFILTLPFFILTLGLFTFVLNAIMLWLTAATSDLFGLRFHVDGFGAAFVGALIVTIVSFALSVLVGRDSRKERRLVARYREM